MPLMKNKLFALFVLVISFFVACKKDDVVEKKNTISTIGYAKAVIDNGDTIYFKHIKKSRYSKNDGPKGNLYIAYENVNDTSASDRQIKFAISKSFNLDFIDFTRPLSPNTAEEFLIMNKSFIDASNAIEIKFQIERAKDSIEMITSAEKGNLNIKYAYLKVASSSFEY
jgi:hypothetical protein